jgi:hypothetical protein
MNEAEEIAMFLCQRSTARCRFCDRASTRLCDFQLAEGKACDIPMCDFCTHRAERTVDYCPEHRGTVAHRPRKDANAPYWIKATWRSQCKMCWRWVKIGEKILWFKLEKKALCEGCGKAWKENKQGLEVKDERV